MVARIEVSDVLGYPVCVGEPEEVLDLLWQRLTAGKRTHVVTLNAEMILAAEREVEAQDALGSADIYVSDGVGLTWAARMLRQDSIHRYPGIDLVYDLMSRLAQNRGSVYLLGGAPGVAVEAGRRLGDDLPGLSVVGTQDGYFAGELESQVVSDITAAKPDLLLVGMGALFHICTAEILKKLDSLRPPKPK